jgi:hypothetical protein
MIYTPRSIGFISGVGVVILLNIIQVAVGVLKTEGDISYGFPFPFYEYLITFNRGFFWGAGSLSILLLHWL